MDKPKYFPDKVKSCPFGMYVLSDDGQSFVGDFDDESTMNIMRMRGFGKLSGQGHAAHKLSTEDASLEQFKWCKFIVEAINEKIEREKNNEKG